MINNEGTKQMDAFAEGVKVGRRLSDLTDQLDDDVHQYNERHFEDCDGYYCQCSPHASALSRSYLLLVSRLSREGNYQAIADAVTVYDNVLAACMAARNRLYARRKALQDAEDRGRAITLSVTCPYCGSEPGQPCRYLVSGKPSKTFHADRYRTGQSLAAKEDG